eukprot:GHVR01073950.1.p1 GENE.GHVR01073950.1~~GHVR01073950.1.p1  ORF type:complete len:245 (+),score=71.54 GHVR01073950.1:41-775(+)
MSNENYLNAFDFSSIEEMDPSIRDGHRVVYDRECPFELRVQDSTDGPTEVGTLEAIKCKILVLGEESLPHDVRVELSSEHDLFFHFTHSVNESIFRGMQEQQKLMIDFNDYVNVLVKMLNSCIKEPHSFLAVFVMQKNGQARLDFIQNMEYKFVELLSCDFAASVEDTVREQITFRYNSIKNKLQMMQTRMQDINALVKVKNPSLLLQLQRGQQAQQQGGSNTHTHTHTQGQSGSKLAAASHKR